MVEEVSFGMTQPFEICLTTELVTKNIKTMAKTTIDVQTMLIDYLTGCHCSLTMLENVFFTKEKFFRLSRLWKNVQQILNRCYASAWQNVLFVMYFHSLFHFSVPFPKHLEVSIIYQSIVGICWMAGSEYSLESKGQYHQAVYQILEYSWNLKLK